MTRHLQASQYGDDLFIEQRHSRYWYAHLQRDWIEELQGPVLQCQPATWLDLLSAHTQHSALGELPNDFSWSYSRANRYRFCPRAYYYHYYAAWEGWLEHSPFPVRRAYLLKNLTDLPRWVGTLVHETLRFAMARLKAGQPVAEADLIKQMHSRAQADFADSHSGRFQQQPNQLNGFQEHYYQTDLPQTTWQTAWGQAERHLQTFLKSRLYARLKQQPANTFLDTETLQSFTLADEKVWVQMDLARRDDEGLYIYDWKTGSLPNEARLRRQLGIYALYFQQAHPELLVDRILHGVVYALAEDRVIDVELDQQSLQETKNFVETSISQLKNLRLDPASNLTDITHFPMVDDLNLCRTCQFRELCGRAG